MREVQPINGRTSIDLRLENFRLFRDSGWFRLAPLTCLVGRNSSGKSSVLSSILLLKQSLEQEGTGWGRGPTPLSLTGQYCDLGNYSDVVHNHDESYEISFSFAVSYRDLGQSYKERGVPFVNLAIPRPSGFNPGYYYGGGDAEKLPKRGGLEVKLGFSPDEPFGPSLRRFEMKAAGLGSVSFVRAIGRERRDSSWQLESTTFPPTSISIETYARTIFPVINLRRTSFSRCSRPTRRRLSVFSMASRLFFNYMRQGLLRSEVVGPFRTPPERRYAFGGFGVSRGPSGSEQAINLLITELLIRPHQERTRSLHRALSFWVKHLKLAGSLDVKDIAKRLNLFEVDVKGAGAKANLADVGFGISQVLPVLVQGLLMRPGGVYLVQQPEIHLHPDAQAGLADFFIYLASYGVITVVETHSEYLLLRIRRRLAEGARPVSMGIPTERPDVSPLTTEDVSVLLTGSDMRHPSVQQLQIGRSFQFENLPKGFMSQALDDRVKLLKAVSEKNA